MAKAAKNENKYTFSVVVNGLQLSEEQQARVRLAVQGAAAEAMAGFDFGGDRLAVSLPLQVGFGRTQGIWYEGVLRDQAIKIAPGIETIGGV